MSINSTLKNEGIRIVGKLNTLEINKIASNISEKITKTFPEHKIDQKDLFISMLYSLLLYMYFIAWYSYLKETNLKSLYL